MVLFGVGVGFAEGGGHIGAVFVARSSTGIDASCSMGCSIVTSAIVRAEPCRYLTSKLVNDCLANWLRCPCDDADEAVQFAI